MNLFERIKDGLTIAMQESVISIKMFDRDTGADIHQWQIKGHHVVKASLTICIIIALWP